MNQMQSVGIGSNETLEMCTTRRTCLSLGRVSSPNQVPRHAKTCPARPQPFSLLFPSGCLQHKLPDQVFACYSSVMTHPEICHLIGVASLRSCSLAEEMSNTMIRRGEALPARFMNVVGIQPVMTAVMTTGPASVASL